MGIAYISEHVVMYTYKAMQLGSSTSLICNTTLICLLPMLIQFQGQSKSGCIHFILSAILSKGIDRSFISLTARMIDVHTD